MGGPRVHGPGPVRLRSARGSGIRLGEGLRSSPVRGRRLKRTRRGRTGARVAAQTETDLENAILTKARQLNLSNAG